MDKVFKFFLYLQNILRSNSRNFLSANSTCWHDTFSWNDNNNILSLRKLMRKWSHINTLSKFILELEIMWQLFDFTSASHKFYNLTTMTFSASYFVCYMTWLNWYGLPLAELTDEMIKSKKNSSSKFSLFSSVIVENADIYCSDTFWRDFWL